MKPPQSRRDLLAGALAVAGGALTTRAAAAAAAAWPDAWPDPEAACRAPAATTPRQTEGPFFRPSTPERRDLRATVGGGRPLDLVGTLTARDCRPLAGAIVELWHADPEGRYDNDGFRCRGHQRTDDRGRFGFRTVVPGLYSGRTRHYHLILAPGAADARPLTTQLYFPDEPRNARDWIFDPALLLRLEQRDGALLGRYDFVVG